MPIIPIRELGSDGVQTDQDPYGAPIKSFSMAVNARFEDKQISRGPIALTVGTLATATGPQFALAYQQLSGSFKFHICNANGKIYDWQNSGPPTWGSTETDISIPAYTPNSYTGVAWTSAVINDVVYVNRPDRPPWFKTKSDTNFTDLSTTSVGGAGWDSSWRCASIREVAGVLVAIGMTESGIQYPAKIRTSDYMTFDNAAITWAPNTTNSATFNTLPDLSEPLVDGVNLGQNLVLYSNHETWLMQPTYNQSMFSYSRLFKNWGVINQNCVAEVNNVHYVFGATDIWKHDGYNQSSIAWGRVRDFVYNNLVIAQVWQFFTYYNPRLNEIMFCYVSKDSACGFPVGGNIGYPGCNRAVVWNLRANTWYFYDLPYVTAITSSIVASSYAYTSFGSETYHDLGGSTYNSYANPAILTALTVAPSVSGQFYGVAGSQTLACAVRTFDRYGSPAAAGLEDTVANAPVYITKSSLDLDDLNENLRQYKVVKSMYPEGRLAVNASPIYFSWGTADYPSSPPPVLGTSQSFDGSTNYKLDFNIAGRYLDIVITYNDTKDFALTGFDFDFQNTGSR